MLVGASRAGKSQGSPAKIWDDWVVKDRLYRNQMRPDSILIVRLSAMGDIVMATPLASALKRTYPMAKICWLVQPEWRDLLAGHPAVDEVLVWPRNEWTELWREKKLLSLLNAVRSFGRYLKGFRFDLGIDALDTVQVGFHSLHRRNLAFLDERRELGSGHERNICFVHECSSRLLD